MHDFFRNSQDRGTGRARGLGLPFLPTARGPVKGRKAVKTEGCAQAKARDSSRSGSKSLFPLAAPRLCGQCRLCASRVVRRSVTSSTTGRGPRSVRLPQALPRQLGGSEQRPWRPAPAARAAPFVEAAAARLCPASTCV